MQARDTIFALSSGALPAGVATIRMSGPDVAVAVRELIGNLPPARHASYSSIRSRKGLILDRGLVTFFPGPGSFTGEDCAEFDVHGGRAVVAAILDELSAIPGLRHAEAGEFTKRAFLNGRLDLMQTEALGDLIQADTEAQRRFAMSNAAAPQRELYESWRGRLLHARAMIEAELDFADESDVPGSVSMSIWADMRSLLDEAHRHIDDFHKAEIIRDGYQVVILGAPNAGKSSLLNALARRDVAIVADEPGTTRDLVEVALDLRGYKVRVVDTAGIRDNAGTVERIGIERARNAAAEADLALLLVEPGGNLPDIVFKKDQLRLSTKADLGPLDKSADLAISTASGAGIDRLLIMIAERAASAAASTSLLPSRGRHVQRLKRMSEALERSLDGTELELRAEELRTAAIELGQITGQVATEELLGAIFSRFCIGK